MLNSSLHRSISAEVDQRQRGPIALYPLELCWDDQDRPLPVRVLRRPLPRPGQPPCGPAFAGLPTGPTDQPFDFTGHVRRLCLDLVVRCPELSHIDVSRLLFAITSARNGSAHGLQARVTPLRFEGGRLTRRRGGVTYQVQRYFHGSHEFLYLVTFCLPRFLDQSFEDKLVTLFHELYHINPSFDGDLRRHHGRYALHTHSQRNYDQHMAALKRNYLARRPDPSLLAFLHLDFAQLQQRHGGVAGVMVPRPKIIPLLDANGEASARTDYTSRGRN
jgi:hypothetical protein